MKEVPWSIINNRVDPNPNPSTHSPPMAWYPSSAADTVWLRSQTQRPDQSPTTATETFQSRFGLETSSLSQSSASCAGRGSRTGSRVRKYFGCDTRLVLRRHVQHSPVQVEGSDEDVLQDLQRRDLRVDCKGSKLHRKWAVALLEHSRSIESSEYPVLILRDCHSSRLSHNSTQNSRRMQITDK